MRKGSERVITGESVEDFFHSALNSALDNQKIAATPNTVRYVVHMLACFMRSDRLYERTDDGYGLKPLALIYADAALSGDLQARNEALRRLGDVALFIAGLFSQSLNRKVVDVDYYVAMGGGAYAQLSSSLGRAPRPEATAPQVFAELSSKFSEFVDALAEVGEDANFSGASDLLRTYEVWLRTGSVRAARRLRRAGIQPAEALISRTRH